MNRTLIPVFCGLVAVIPHALAAQTAPAPGAAAGGQSQAPAPGTPPLAAAAPAAPSVPFRPDGRVAYLNVQAVMALSNVGKTAGLRVQTFRDAKALELEARRKTIEAKQQRLAAGATLLGDTARVQLQTEIERDARELNRMAEDADEDLQRLSQQAQQEFLGTLQIAVQRVAIEKQLDLLFTEEARLGWHAADLDLTQDVIRALDSANVNEASSNPAAGTSAAASSGSASPAP
jgi:Skp family chaperone for outer membrane proteins